MALRRTVLVLVAFALAFAATFVSTRPAQASDIPTFPEGVRAPRGGDSYIYYLQPGNMIRGAKTRVTLNGEDMTKRGDGVWYLVTARPNRRHVFHLKMWTSTEEWSNWTKFKKIWR